MTSNKRSDGTRMARVELPKATEDVPRVTVGITAAGAAHGSSGSGLSERPGGHWSRRYVLMALLMDVLAVSASLSAAVVIRFRGAQTVEGIDLTYLELSALTGLAWIGVLAASRCYEARALGYGDDEYRRILRATFVLFGLLSMTALLLQFDFARGYLAVALPLGATLLLMGRWILRRGLHNRRAKGASLDGALMIGTKNDVLWAAERLGRARRAGFAVTAVAFGNADQEPELVLSDGTAVRNMGEIDDTVDHLLTSGLRTVIVADGPGTDRRFLRNLSWQLEDTSVQMAVTSRLSDVADTRLHWHPVDGLPLAVVTPSRFTGGKYAVKRLLDVVGAVLALILAAPVMALTALAVKLEDGGPVFYRQWRVGENGTQFTMTKFRSMHTDAHAMKAHLMSANQGTGALFKMRNDPRVTVVGRVIRALSIDELPQLLDVLRGTMSLVGPRPQLPEEAAQLAEHQRRRMKVKPGITGPWQVGGRSDLSADESMRLDLTYIENWSLTGDLVILLKTVRAVLARDGAY